MSARSSLIQLVDPPSLGPANSAFSNIVIVPLSDTIKQINISGQVATTLDGNVPDSLEDQMDVCLAKVRTCLRECGATVHDMTKLMYYFTEKAWEREGALGIAVKKAEEWLEGHRPASCCLIVKSLSQPEFLCEFEAQAVIRVGR